MSATKLDRDPTAGSSAPTPRRPKLGRRIATAVLLGALVISLLLAVPGLQPVAREIRSMSWGWIVAAVALELASCLSFVVLFRLFFDRVGPREARPLAWTSMASGALLPGGGVGGLAIGGWLIHLIGASTSWIVRRSSALFFFTTAVNAAAVIGAALLLLVLGPFSGPGELGRVGIPLLIAVPATALIAALPWVIRRGRRRETPSWLGGIVEGIRDAELTAARPSWRLVGAIGYLGFDIAVLWATFSAIGHVPTIPVLVLGYTIGYLANALPVPGGVGVLDAGLAGALVLYGASPARAGAAVLVYHAIAFWIPALGGVIAYSRLRPRLVDDPAAEPPDVLSPTPEGEFDDSGRSDGWTHAGRLGGVHDERPRARPLPRNRGQMARVALRPTARRQVSPDSPPQDAPSRPAAT